MIKKLLTLSLLIFLISCADKKRHTSNFGIENSNISNLSFENINNIKEYKVCSETGGKTAIGQNELNNQFFRIIFWPLFLLPSSSNIDQGYESSKYALISGDSSISSAVKLGGITKIKMIDHSYEMTGLFERQFCVIVYGE